VVAGRSDGVAQWKQMLEKVCAASASGWSHGGLQPAVLQSMTPALRIGLSSASS